MTVERSKRRFLIPLVFVTKCFKKPLLLRIVNCGALLPNLPFLASRAFLDISGNAGKISLGTAVMKSLCRLRVASLRSLTSPKLWRGATD